LSPQIGQRAEQLCSRHELARARGSQGLGLSGPNGIRRPRVGIIICEAVVMFSNPATTGRSPRAGGVLPAISRRGLLTAHRGGPGRGKRPRTGSGPPACNLPPLRAPGEIRLRSHGFYLDGPEGGPGVFARQLPPPTRSVPSNQPGRKPAAPASVSVGTIGCHDGPSRLLEIARFNVTRRRSLQEIDDRKHWGRARFPRPEAGGRPRKRPIGCGRRSFSRQPLSPPTMSSPPVAAHGPPSTMAPCAVVPETGLRGPWPGRK